MKNLVFLLLFLNISNLEAKKPSLGNLVPRFLGIYEAIIDKGDKFVRYHSSCVNPVYRYVREKVPSGEIPDLWIEYSFQSTSKLRIVSSQIVDGKYPQIKLQVSPWSESTKKVIKEMTFTDFNGLRVLSVAKMGKVFSYMHEDDLKSETKLKTSSKKCD